MAKRGRKGRGRRRARVRRGRRVRETPVRGAAVMINLPKRPLAYADAIFEIFYHGEKLGEIRISRGGLDWYSRNAKKRKRLGWQRLARVLDAVGGRK